MTFILGVVARRPTKHQTIALDLEKILSLERTFAPKTAVSFVDLPGLVTLY